MASKLSLNPFPISTELYSQHHRRSPLFYLRPSKNSSNGHHYCSKSISTSKGQTSVTRSVKQEMTEVPNTVSQTNPHSSTKLILVVGGSGGVGQLIVASLLSRNIKSRLLLRDPEKATTLFGKQDEGKLQVRKGDTRNPEDLDPSIFEVCSYDHYLLITIQKTVLLLLLFTQCMLLPLHAYNLSVCL